MSVEFVPVLGDRLPSAAATWTEQVPAEVLAAWDGVAKYLERTLVAVRDESGRVLAAALESHRPATAYAKLLPVWTADAKEADVPGGAAADPGTAEPTAEAVPAAAGVLTDAVAAWAAARGKVVLKLELGAGQVVPAGFEDAGLPVVGAPVLADPKLTPAGAVKWLGAGAASDFASASPADGETGANPVTRPLPYYRQTTEITCGPVAMLMGLAGLGKGEAPTRGAELQAWREATTGDGCDPYGVALAAADRGANVTASLTTDDAILLELAPDDEARGLRRFIQHGFRDRVDAAGIPRSAEAFTLADLDAVLDGGGVALVLIDEILMHAESCPHWIVVHARLGAACDPGAVYIAQDPWTDAGNGETWLDGHNLPIPAAALDRMAWYGEPAVRSLVTVS